MMTEILIIGFALALFCCLLIMMKKEKRTPDFFLAGFILLISLYLFTLYGEQQDWGANHLWPLIGDLLYWNLLGPLLFMYITLILKEHKLHWRDLLHLSPLVLVSLSFLTYITQVWPEKTLMEFLMEGPHLFGWMGYYLFLLVSPAYYIVALVTLLTIHKRFKNFYSSRPDIDFAWLFYLTIGFALFLISGVLMNFFQQITGISFSFSVYTYSPVILTAYIIGIGILGIRRFKLFVDYPTFVKYEQESKTESNLSYQKSGLKNDEALKIRSRLIEIMDLEKPYLNEDLSLNKLAQQMDTTSHKLSEVLNKRQNESFFNFINRYRVEESKQMLMQPDYSQYTLAAIGIDSGFKSKSAFYTCFKKYTGQTPSEYKTQLS